jgi:hypothetical protein
MVNRLDLLHMQIGSPELQAVTKLLDALRKDMRTEVQQKLLARFAHTDDWTVCHAGDIAEEIERNAAELTLYTGVTVGRDIAARWLTMCGNHGFALQLAYGITC